jgi:predicted DNA binding protein
MAKKHKIKDSFLEELKKIPIVQVACERISISRNSIYRWKREDEDFSKLMDKALAEGEDLVNDMSESQLLTLIKEKNFSAIRFWLNHRNPKFKDKVEVTTKTGFHNDKLTPEQETIVKRALEIATSLKTDKKIL